MNRRDAVSGLLALGAMTGPLRANAQATKEKKPFRLVTLPDQHPVLRGWFSDAMRDLGWMEGRDFIVIESGFQHGGSRLDEVVKRVVATKPDLFLTMSTASAVAVHRATATIPIVMLFSAYPVEAGVANSLARPGKNLTGNTVNAGLGVWGKLLQLLREVKPDVKRVSVLWTYVAFRDELEPMYAELRKAEGVLDLKVHIVDATTGDEVPAALTEIDKERPDALLLTSGFVLNFNLASTVTQFAVKKRLPTITDLFWPPPIEPYPLMVYGPVVGELVRSAAASVDKILKGAQPGDLPIQQPTKFEMIVNLKTATAIGLTIPQSILLRADRVIE